MFKWKFAISSIAVLGLVMVSGCGKETQTNPFANQTQPVAQPVQQQPYNPGNNWAPQGIPQNYYPGFQGLNSGYAGFYMSYQAGIPSYYYLSQFGQMYNWNAGTGVWFPSKIRIKVCLHGGCHHRHRCHNHASRRCCKPKCGGNDNDNPFPPPGDDDNDNPFPLPAARASNQAELVMLDGSYALRSGDGQFTRISDAEANRIRQR